MMLRIKLCFCVPSSDGTYQVKRSVSAVMSNTCNTSRVGLRNSEGYKRDVIKILMSASDAFFSFLQRQSASWLHRSA